MKLRIEAKVDDVPLHVLEVGDELSNELLVSWLRWVFKYRGAKFVTEDTTALNALLSTSWAKEIINRCATEWRKEGGE